MNNIFNSIDKAKATASVVNAGLVGFAFGLGYFLTHLSPEVWGPLAAPIAVVVTLAHKALKKYLPADADVVKPTVGLQGLHHEAHVAKLEEQAGKVVQAVGKHLEAR
jgi:hypothetical protein